MKVHEILAELKSTNSRLKKEDILARHKDNQDFRTYINLCTDPFITFYIRKIPKYTPGTSEDLAIAMDALDKISSRTVTGNAAIAHLTDILSSLTAENGKVIESIINKKPDCGVAGKTINKAWDEEFVKEFPLMKATEQNDKLLDGFTWPAISQTKLNGTRCQVSNQVAISPSDNGITMYSSNGREFDFKGFLDGHWDEYFGKNVVIDGEMLVLEEDGSIMPRKKGNGIIGRALKGTFPKEMTDRLLFVVFDVIDLDAWGQGFWKASYQYRWNWLKTRFNKIKSKNIRLVESKIVYNVQEAIQHFKELYADGAGEEGTILKELGAPWEGKRSRTQLKFKGLLTADLIVTGYNEGTGKYKGMIGSLICESSDGMLSVSVSGLTDAQRKRPFCSWVGKIVEVAYNEKILSKAEGAKYSLFLPRLVEERFDKDEADSISLIK